MELKRNSCIFATVFPSKKKISINLKHKRMKNRSNFLFLLMALLVCVMTFTLSACGGDDDGAISPPAYQGSGNDSISGKPETPEDGTLQLMRICGDCDGEKDCPQCNGTGKGCGRCGGTGKYCKDCGSTGRCQECRGTRKCSSCGGDRLENCSHCTRWPGHCSTCDGRGWTISSSYKCNTCGGSGKCKYCVNGNTDKICWYCDGTGICPCGDGSCSTCHGNPMCPTCGGDGHCLSCVGSGQCRNCKGTGETQLSSLSFPYSGGDATVLLHCSAEWDVTTDAEWIRFSPSYGSGNKTVIVTAEVSEITAPREGVITFTSGNSTATLSVLQWGEPIRLNVEPANIFVSAYGSGEKINVSSNTSWTVEADDPWVTCTPSSGSGNVAVTVRASTYTTGTRYTTLRFTDSEGQVSAEVLVAQAQSREALTALKNYLEKPLGIFNVNLKTASYYEVKNAIKSTYIISTDYPQYKTFTVSTWDNSSLGELTYQGMKFSSFEFEDYSGSSNFNQVSYNFSIKKTDAPDGYKNILSNIVQDFKYNMNAPLIKDENPGAYTEIYSGRDTNNNLCGIRVQEYSDSYSFNIYHYYYK